MYSNGTLPLDAPLDPRCGYSLKKKLRINDSIFPSILPHIQILMKLSFVGFISGVR